MPNPNGVLGRVAKLLGWASDRSSESVEPPVGTMPFFARTAQCANCARATAQLRHGFDRDGKLWKGHVCVCAGWECTECRSIVDRESECCR